MNIQGDLYTVDFSLEVSPCCLHAKPGLPDLQLPSQKRADIETTESK